MKQITTNVYEFGELSEEGKQKAIETYKRHQDFDYVYEEARDSLNKFAEIFDINITNFDFLEMHRSEYIFNLHDNILNLSGQRLGTYIWNNYKSQLFKGKYYGKLVYTNKDGTSIEISKEHPNGSRHVRRYSKCTLDNSCVLTGVCYDMDILDPIYKFLNKPTSSTFEDLLTDCLHNLAKTVEKEIEACSEDSYIIEQIESNEYTFTEDGERFD